MLVSAQLSLADKVDQYQIAVLSGFHTVRQVNIFPINFSFIKTRTPQAGADALLWGV